VTRYTFVIQIHPDGPSTLENLSTREQVPVSDLAAVGPQIERWLEALDHELDGRTEAGYGVAPGSGS
jgi:hypothetical protein